MSFVTDPARQPGACAADVHRFRGRAGQSLSLRSVQLLLLITVLSIVPGLAVMVTCFPSS